MFGNQYATAKTLRFGYSNFAQLVSPCGSSFSSPRFPALKKRRTALEEAQCRATVAGLAVGSSWIQISGVQKMHHKDMSGIQ